MKPNRKPSTGDPQDEFDYRFRQAMLDVDDMLPCRIVQYDKETKRASLEILYRVTMTDGTTNQMVAPAEIRIVHNGGGNHVLTFDFKAGNKGWIKATDRDLSLFWDTLEAQPGNTPRIHSFEDSVFIPDVMDPFNTPEGASLQTLDGSARCTVLDDAVECVVGSSQLVVKDDSATFTIGSCTFTITDSGVVCNKPIKAPDFTDGSIKMIGHNHSNPEGGDVGPMKNP